LAYANQHRPWQYQTIFLELLGHCQEVSNNRRRKFRFKNKLLSLDATVIDLCASLYDWAKFRRTKGAIKLHLLLDHGRLPASLCRDHGRQNPRVERCPQAALGVGHDCGVRPWYIDYEWFVELTRQGVYWVKRLGQRRLLGGRAAAGAGRRRRAPGGEVYVFIFNIAAVIVRLIWTAMQTIRSCSVTVCPRSELS
jgi:hypothetical protein